MIEFSYELDIEFETPDVRVNLNRIWRTTAQIRQGESIHIPDGIRAVIRDIVWLTDGGVTRPYAYVYSDTVRLGRGFPLKGWIQEMEAAGWKVDHTPFPEEQP